MRTRTITAVTLAALLAVTSADAQMEPLAGQPAPGAKPSAADLETQVVYQRAFEAVVWAMPASAIYRFRVGSLAAAGIGDNDVMALSKPATARFEALTANNVTPYIMGFTDLRKGPVVMEVPAKTDQTSLYGQIVDAWQVTIADVGPAGEDKGAGAKYLLIPPGYKNPIPAGYLPIQSQSYRLAFVFRSVPQPGVSVEAANAYTRTLKLYPLADAAAPKPTRFVDAWSERIPTLPLYDIGALQDIYDIVSVEPVRPRDKVMMGMLASIGIEPSKPFNPEGKVKAAMERGVVDAYFYMQQRRARLAETQAYWPDRHWQNFLNPDNADAKGGFEYETPDAVEIDRRADTFFPGTFYPRVMPKKAATVYMAAYADSESRPFESGNTYRLRMPKDVPVDQFWALIVYDMATYAFIYDPLNRVGLSSRERSSMKVNNDGSVDLYFGPNAPDGLESNWVSTQGKVPAPVMRFYGAQDAFWDKTFKLPDVELVR